MALKRVSGHGRYTGIGHIYTNRRKKLKKFEIDAGYVLIRGLLDGTMSVASSKDELISLAAALSRDKKVAKKHKKRLTKFNKKRHSKGAKI